MGGGNVDGPLVAGNIHTRLWGSWGVLVAVRLRLGEAHLPARQRGQLVEADVRPVDVRPGQGVRLRIPAAQGDSALSHRPVPGSCMRLKESFTKQIRNSNDKHKYKLRNTEYG